MAYQIVVKHREGSSGEPSGLLTGEVAANLTDKHIYIGTGAGNLVFKDSDQQQPISANLTDLSALAVTNGYTIRADGTNFVLVKNTLDGVAAPNANADIGAGYVVGSMWIDTTNDKAYICVDNASTAAVWLDVTAAGVGGGGDLSLDGGFANSVYTAAQIVDGGTASG